MSWAQRVIGVVVVMVLTGLPVAGTLCALVCASIMSAAPGETATARHHGSTEDCQEPPTPTSSSGVQIGAVSQHPCGEHNGASQPHATVVPARAHANLVASPGMRTVSQVAYIDVPSSGSESAYSPPQRIAPPTSTPVVLRV